MISKPTFHVPDRSDPAVRQEEARVAAVLATKAEGLSLQESTDCRVRLLRQAGPVDYVYARCIAGGSGFSSPLKLVGDTVTMPEDGSSYAPSIRRIFPEDIADALLADQRGYSP